MPIFEKVYLKGGVGLTMPFLRFQTLTFFARKKLFPSDDRNRNFKTYTYVYLRHVQLMMSFCFYD